MARGSSRETRVVVHQCSSVGALIYINEDTLHPVHASPDLEPRSLSITPHLCAITALLGESEGISNFGFKLFPSPSVTLKFICNTVYVSFISIMILNKLILV